MFETFAGIILALIMTGLWMIAALTASGLPYAATNQRLKRRRTFLTGVIYLALTAAGLWLIIIMKDLVLRDWLFVEGKIKAIVPVMMIGNLSVLIYTLPLLKGLRKSNHEQLAKETLFHAAHPMLHVPIYAAAIVSGLTVFSSIFEQPVLPGFNEIVQKPILLILILFVPHYFARRRYLKVQRGEFIVYPIWKRLLRVALAGIAAATVVIAVIVLNVLTGMHSSRLPEASDMMNHHKLDEGGGSLTRHSGHHYHHSHSAADSGMVPVAALTGDISAPADIQFEVIAQQRKLTLASGAEIDSWTYNGQIAPELRVRHGDMVEVKLINKDIEKGATIHWHGYNVPNAMDGVPGMTQNVVMPGQSFTYKFRAEQEGTYWFHSHQLAAEQVEKGLFGSLIVDHKDGTEVYDEELTVINHRWKTEEGYKNAFGNRDQEQLKRVEPGRKVKLRIINTHNLSRKYVLQGTDYQITSIDGVRIEDPGLLSDQTAFRIASGGRYDVAFTMPDHPVLFKIGDNKNLDEPSIVFYTDVPPANPVFKADSSMFDAAQYGKPVVNAVTGAKKFDREFTMILGNKMGFYNGKLHFLWTVNGKVHPHTPTFVVKEGEYVKTTFVNNSLTEHPMHLHGHHMTVLKKNGKKVKTPWVTDTLNVESGTTYEVAFVADNPGMWMDHCHNLDHAATGMILHLMYDHVVPSYEVGTRSGNLPD
ncbi:multicopper oxidase family protein [Paenibacillus tarimensis]